MGTRLLIDETIGVRDMLNRIKRKLRKNNESLSVKLRVQDDTEVAEDLVERCEVEQKKILVVGKEEIFSRPVVDYALGFAERMGYEIVALNILPLPTDSPKLAPYCSLISDDFKNKCEESVAHFYRACKEKGIGFQHIVKTGDPEQCIKETHREIKRIEFVICDPEVCPSMAEEVEEGIIPVFCLANA